MKKTFLGVNNAYEAQIILGLGVSGVGHTFYPTRIWHPYGTCRTTQKIS